MRAGAVVIEDDYDSEFRYDVAPVPALAALDRDRVAYLGTTSKTVAPSMRLGWLVAPADLHRAILARRAITHDVARVAGAARVPLPAPRRLRRPGRPLGPPDVRRPRRAGGRRAARRTPSRSCRWPGCTPPCPMPQARALRAHALRAGSRASRCRCCSDYCRTARLTGLIIGFGGCTDDELDRALAAIVRGLA